MLTGTHKTHDKQEPQTSTQQRPRDSTTFTASIRRDHTHHLLTTASPRNSVQPSPSNPHNSVSSAATAPPTPTPARTSHPQSNPRRSPAAVRRQSSSNNAATPVRHNHRPTDRQPRRRRCPVRSLAMAKKRTYSHPHPIAPSLPSAAAAHTLRAAPRAHLHTHPTRASSCKKKKTARYMG